ncbi:MAG TPA: dihydrodipicolinate synthase family protein [Terriglobales bacterium]|nr:dihydrodipicolinate synthase family protein [Terriglobales bacterium]
MPKLTGVVPPIGTPLTKDERVDEPALRRLTRYLVDAGVNGILANGTMGGFAFLTDEEQVRAISIVVSEVDGCVPVMGGIGETSTSRAVRKAKEIAKQGVTHLTVLAPFYFFASQENLYAYFSDIAAAVDLPIFLYDNPVMTKNSLSPETVARLREDVPHIVGLKESNQDCINLQKVIELNQGPDFSILTGSEFLIVVGLQMGCDGFIGGLHNLCPHIAVALYRAYCRGDIESALKLQKELAAVWELFRYGNIWGAFDQALRHLGIADCATGAPYVSRLNAQDAAKVNAIIDKHVKPHLCATAK